MTANRQKTCRAVLFVEDDPLIRWSGVDLLQDCGFDVIEAADADKALSILESRSDVLLLVTDVDMPGSMDGLALAAIARRRRPDLHIIISSGRCELAGKLAYCDCFIPKPYAPQEMARRVQASLA